MNSAFYAVVAGGKVVALIVSEGVTIKNPAYLVSSWMALLLSMKYIRSGSNQGMSFSSGRISCIFCRTYVQLCIMSKFSLDSKVAGLRDVVRRSITQRGLRSKAW